MVTINFEPMRKTLIEVVEHLERLEVRTRYHLQEVWKPEKW